MVDNVDPLTVEVVTDADGTFETGGLPPGQYSIWFSDPQHRVLQDVRSGILVESGGTIRLDVELIVPGVITGTVLGGRRSTAADAAVDPGDRHRAPRRGRVRPQHR